MASVRRERRNVINVYVLKARCARANRDLCKFAGTVELVTIDIIDHDVVDAIALPVEGGATVICQDVGDLKSTTHMANRGIANRHIGDLANRAEMEAIGPALILGCQHDGKTDLGETTPTVLHDVAIEQNTLPIFHFKQVLDDKWIAVRAPYVAGSAVGRDNEVFRPRTSPRNVGAPGGDRQHSCHL